MFLLVVKEPVSVMLDIAVQKDMNCDLRDGAGVIMGIYWYWATIWGYALC